MTYNLFDLTLKVAKELEVVYSGLATGGSTTTVIDTNNLAAFANDHWNLGTVWIERDAGGAGAAPQGEYARVSDFAQGTSTVTMAAVSVAVAAGDLYGIANKEYKLDTIIAQINRALREIMVPTEDIVSITTATDQTEYNLPAAVLDQDIEVYIQGKTGDTNDYRWQPYHDWYIRQAAAGTAKLLTFKTQPPYPYLLRIVYYLPHADLYASTDRLHEMVDVNRIVLQAALNCLRHKIWQPGVHKQDLDQRIGDMTARAERAKWAQPMGRTHVKLASWGEQTHWIEIED